MEVIKVERQFKIGDYVTVWNGGNGSYAQITEVWEKTYIERGHEYSMYNAKYLYEDTTQVGIVEIDLEPLEEFLIRQYFDRVNVK